jgi:hypothetical protein
VCEARTIGGQLFSKNALLEGKQFAKLAVLDGNQFAKHALLEGTHFAKYAHEYLSEDPHRLSSKLDYCGPSMHHDCLCHMRRRNQTRLGPQQRAIECQ